MKVISINFIKETDKVPERTRNTESAQIISQIGDALKKSPLGVRIATKDAKKWQRYALQRRLQKAGHKVTVTTSDGGFFWVVPVK